MEIALVCVERGEVFAGIIRYVGRHSKPVLSPKPTYRQVASFSIPDELFCFNQFFWVLDDLGPGRLLGSHDFVAIQSNIFFK